MLRMMARRQFIRQVDPNTDEVLFGVTLPSGTVLHGMNVKSNFLGSAESATVVNVFGIAFEIWILPILDPDAGLSYQTIWDNLVPKDQSAGGLLDLDTAAADVTPFWEPGEIDWTSVWDIGLQPRRLFHTHSYITLANGALIVWQDNQSTFLLKYWPGGSMPYRMKRNFRITQPSVLVMACSSPNLDVTTTTEPTVLTESELPQVKYMGDVLKRALMQKLGLTEAGAETPWIEAATLLSKQLDPALFEFGSGIATTTLWNVTGEAEVDMSVEGELQIGSLSTGR